MDPNAKIASLLKEEKKEHSRRGKVSSKAESRTKLGVFKLREGRRVASL